MPHLTAYQWYWVAWFVGVLGTFLPVELYAVFSGHVENTLSWSIWDLEGFVPGSHAVWTWSHWIVGGALFLLCLWLAVHFMFGWLR